MSANLNPFPKLLNEAKETFYQYIDTTTKNKPGLALSAKVGATLGTLGFFGALVKNSSIVQYSPVGIFVACLLTPILSNELEYRTGNKKVIFLAYPTALLITNLAFKVGITQPISAVVACWWIIPIALFTFGSHFIVKRMQQSIESNLEVVNSSTSSASSASPLSPIKPFST